MNIFPLPNALLVSVRIYRAMLVAYPKTFREHYETQMVQVFRDSFREAFHNNGIPGVVELWIHTFFDLLFTALIERISERSQYMFSPKVVLWGGVAGLFSGILWLIGGLSPSSGGVTMGLDLVLGLGGLVSLYSRQARQGGKLGLAGFALGIIGTAVMLATLWWDSASEAQSILIDMSGLAVLGIGLALLGLASLRAKPMHRWQGLPLGLGLLHPMLVIAIWRIIYVPLSHGQNPWNPWTPAAYLPIFALMVLIGIGWMGLGITLIAESNPEIAPVPPASA